MHWILAAILALRTLIPCGIAAQSALPLLPDFTGTCTTSAAASASDSIACICCEIGSCACEMAPAPAVPSPAPKPATPVGSSSVRPILLSVEPPTLMVLGWTNEFACVPTPAAFAPAHASLGHSIQAALCIWRT